MDLAAERQQVIHDIDQLVSKIRRLVSQVDPIQLMHLNHVFWFGSTMRTADPRESAMDLNNITASHLLPYIQSVIVGTPPDKDQKEITREEHDTLVKWVEELHTTSVLRYYIADTRYQKENTPNFDTESHEMARKLQFDWQASSQRYSVEEIPFLTELLMPHDATLKSAFGLGAQDILKGLEKLQHSLVQGVGSALMAMHAMNEKLSNRMERMRRGKDLLPGASLQMEFEELAPLIARDEGFEGEYNSALTIRQSLMNLDHFDVGKITGWSSSFMDLLSFKPGEDTKFFAAGDFAGWLLREFPVAERPFLKVDGRYFCFEEITVFDVIYRRLQKLVRRQNPALGEQWDKDQNRVTEHLPIQYLQHILPSLTVDFSLYYKFKKPGSTKTEWAEIDAVATYRDQLMLLEIKGGAFTYTNPTTDLEAHVKSLKALVQAPALQADRLLQELNTHGTLQLYDQAKTRVIRTLTRSDFHDISRIAVTLDGVSSIGPIVAQLHKLGLQVPETWVVTLSDLRMYSHLFEGRPLRFLHYLKQVMKTIRVAGSQPGDEMDRLGMYFHHNALTKQIQHHGEEHFFAGYRDEFDVYYAQLGAGEKPEKPGPPTMPYFDRLVEQVALNTPNGMQHAFILLDVPNDAQVKLDAWLSERVPAATVGLSQELEPEHPVTIMLLDSRETHQRPLARTQTQIRMRSCGWPRVLVAYVYVTPAGQMLHVDTEILVNTMPEDQQKASWAAHRKQKIQQFAKAQKLGGNAPCPCRSGKKYKHCCKI